jgi:phage terminase large subunit-like protein
VLLGAQQERADGKWAATEVGLVVPRQNGKTEILKVRETAGLVLWGERLQTHTAHRMDTSQDHFRAMRDLFTNWSDLSRLVRKIPEGNGAEAIELMSGQRLVFKARAKQGGRGPSGDLVVFDEAFWLQDIASLVPSLSARPNPQIYYASSAPLDRPESDVLRRLVRRGRKLATAA